MRKSQPFPNRLNSVSTSFHVVCFWVDIWTMDLEHGKLDIHFLRIPPTSFPPYCPCERGEGVQGVLTLCSGVAQAFHDDRGVELKEQLEVQEEDGDRQEEKVKVEREMRVKESAPCWWPWWRYEMRSELESWGVRCHHQAVEQRCACSLNACTPRVRWSAGALCQRRHWCRAWWAACCTRRSSCCLWWCCGSSHTCSHSNHRSHCFHRSLFTKDCAVLEEKCLHSPLAVHEFWTVMMQYINFWESYLEYVSQSLFNKFPRSISAGSVFVVMLIRTMPPGFLPVPPRWGITLPSLLMSCIFLVFELSQGWQCLLEVRSMPNWHRIRTNCVRTFFLSEFAMKYSWSPGFFP